MRAERVLALISLLLLASCVAATSLEEADAVALPALLRKKGGRKGGKKGGKKAGKACHRAVKEPKVPNLPKWAGASLKKLQRSKKVKVLKIKGKKTGAFVRKREMVIKKCDANSLHAAVSKSEPQWGGGEHPKWSIFFDCGKKKRYTITIRSTLIFGSGAASTSGNYKLIAPKRNVELSGGNKRRIMLQYKQSYLLVSGITFKNGKSEGWGRNLDKLPKPGGYNGAALGCDMDTKTVVHRCQFLNNYSKAYFLSKGQGGAIYSGNRGEMTIWGCKFQNNVANGGGAVAGGYSRTMHIANSKFTKNSVTGGIFLGAVDKGHKKPFVVTRAAAVRVDRISPHLDGSKVPHVIMCDNSFTGNKISFKSTFLKRYNYKNKDWKFTRASGAAVWVFNTPGNLNLKRGDQKLALIKNCKFKGNSEAIQKSPIDSAGAYVLETEGSGDIHLENLTFTRNKVEKALVRLLAQKPPHSIKSFTLSMKKIKCKGNGNVDTAFFIPPPKTVKPVCEIKKVDGLKSGRYNCFRR